MGLLPGGRGLPLPSSACPGRTAWPEYSSSPAGAAAVCSPGVPFRVSSNVAPSSVLVPYDVEFSGRACFGLSHAVRAIATKAAARNESFIIEASLIEWEIECNEPHYIVKTLRTNRNLRSLIDIDIGFAVCGVNFLISWTFEEYQPICFICPALLF
jgi:hypothetical protein